MSLHIYTYATDDEKLAPLLESAALHSVHIENIAPTKVWNGLNDKFIVMKERLQTLPDRDIVCFIDAYDVLVNADTDTIYTTFRNAKCDLVFGAEKNIHPAKCGNLPFPPSTSEFRFLNSGCYIGYVFALKEMLNWSTLADKQDDQEYSILYFLDSYKEKSIKLDTDIHLVLNMFGVPWHQLSISNKVLTFEYTNTTPCFIHFNGMSYLDIKKDFVHLEDGLHWNTKDVCIDRLHCFLDAKVLSAKHPVSCYITARGHTYTG